MNFGADVQVFSESDSGKEDDEITQRAINKIRRILGLNEIRIGAEN